MKRSILTVAFLSSSAIAFLFGLSGCTDTLLNPEQVVSQTGYHYEGNQLLNNTEALTSVDNNEPFHIIHVLLGNEGGDGTFEAPFGLVNSATEVATSGSIILVQHGSNPGIPDFTVPEGVRFLSDAGFHVVDTRQVGRITLPRAGLLPRTVVTGTATLSSNAEISGFDFTSQTGKGIQGANLSNLTIRYNRFTATKHQAIYLINTTGSLTITENDIRGTQGGEFEPACQEEFFSTGCPGIYVENHAGTMDLLINRNAIFDVTGDGMKIVTTDEAHTTALADSNTVRGSVGAGIKFFTLRHGRLTTTVSNNVISKNKQVAAQDGGIRIGSFNTIVAFANVINNEIFDNESNGLFIGTEDSSDVTVTILDNMTNDNIGNGVFIGAQQHSFERGVIANNTSNGNKQTNRAPGFPTGHGFFVGTLGSGTHDGTLVSANRAIGNATNGFFLASFNAGRSTVTVVDNIAADNVLNGLEFNVGLNIPPPGPDEVEPPLPPVGQTQGHYTVINNSVTGNQGLGPPGLEGGGVMILTFNGAIMNISMERNRVNRNGIAPGGFAGIGILAFDNSTLNAGLRQNTLAFNDANPAVNAQALGAVPPAVPVPGQIPKICLALADNVSDSGYLLNRSQGTSFRAETTGNLGPFIIQTLPLEPIGDCIVP